jgi:hypothetical protein
LSAVGADKSDGELDGIRFHTASVRLCARHWTEGPDGGHALGSKRTYIDVSSGFHPGDGRADNGEPIIVCDICDQIQPD